MKKEYIKPIIINIKIYNDDALCQMQRASLFDINEVNSVEHIADDNGGPIITDEGTDNEIIWND